jgi:hypothetical protein
MRDWRDRQLRYLAHFDDGGSGMRMRDDPLEVGRELDDGGSRYRVAKVEPPPNSRSFGHAGAHRSLSSRRATPHPGT